MLSPELLLGFLLLYYIVAHAINGIVKRYGSKDFNQVSGFQAWLLHCLILIHNTALAVYGSWMFAILLSFVVKFFVQGWKAAGFDGIKLALCSVPTNCPHLGKYTYIL